MVRQSLLAVAALLVAAPLTAQDEHTWTSDRPDGHAPLGIHADRVLPLGAFQISYRFAKMDDEGVVFDNRSLPLSTTFQFYDVAPLAQDNLSHELELAYGATEDLTLLGSIRYHQMERQQLTADETLYITEAKELGDTELSALYRLYQQGPYTAQVHAGVLIPTGQEEVSAETPFSTPGEEALSYDMRPGAGVFAALPGFTTQMQNEVGSVGAQVNGRIHLGTNDSGFTPGDRLSLTGWAAYNLNDAFSISGRLAYETWDAIEGFDPELDPDRDPSHDGFFAEGSLVTIPVGINFVMPEGSPLAGHRLALEYIHPIDQDFEGPQLAFSKGLVVGWQVVF